MPWHTWRGVSEHLHTHPSAILQIASAPGIIFGAAIRTCRRPHKQMELRFCWLHLLFQKPLDWISNFLFSHHVQIFKRREISFHNLLVRFLSFAMWLMCETESTVVCCGWTGKTGRKPLRDVNWFCSCCASTKVALSSHGRAVTFSCVFVD